MYCGHHQHTNQSTMPMAQHYCSVDFISDSEGLAFLQRTGDDGTFDTRIVRQAF